MVERDVAARHKSKVDQTRDLSLASTPTHANPPEGVDRHNIPIMVAEYVNLMAPVERRGELKASAESVPHPLSDAYRRGEMAVTMKEKEMLKIFERPLCKLNLNISCCRLC